MKRRLALVAFVVALLGLVGVAIARPGGGHSYSGGGGHGSSGGGGGGGGGIFELLYWLLRLIIEVPQIGVPIVCLIIGYFVYSAIKQARNKDWDSGPPVELEQSVSLDTMRTADPDFSSVLFEDFAFRLFSTAHRARHSTETLDTVAPYVSKEARFALQTRKPPATPVLSVVIGAMRVVKVDVPNELAGNSRSKIAIEFEANVTTAEHTYYSVELWRYSRAGDVHTKPPASRNFPCPNCGAPWASSETGTQKCASCGEVVDNGRFDWVVDQIVLRSMDQRPPTLGEDVPERGTDLPTYRHPYVDTDLQRLFEADPAITEEALFARLGLIYSQLNVAWAKNDMTPTRGLVSDGLYDYLAYWTEAYKRQDLRNELKNMRITQHAFAKVTRDRWYDAVTIRIWGTGLDYTEKISNGSLVTGSKRRERKYSEYWTLIRSASRKGAPVTEPKCSNCGAELKITMAGACEFCGQHVTSGEFDWVLSKIEQDDSYRG